MAYLYELICMEGEMGVESAKTINSSSGVLSCFLDYGEQTMKEVIIDSIRRSVVYSLYKNIDVGNRALDCLKEYLCPSLIIHIFTELRIMLEKSEPRYLLNRVFLDDFCVYLMTNNLENELGEIKKSLKEVKVSEEDLDLDIEGNEELEISNVGESNSNTLG